MTPSGVKSLIFSSRSLLSFSALLLVVLSSILLSETEARKVSRYNRKEFREYLALKRRASEAERRAYYDQHLRVYNVCPQGFIKATDGKCYLNVPSTSRFQSVVPHRRFVRTPEHFGQNPFRQSWRQPAAPSVSRIQRSPEQHGRHRFGHSIPQQVSRVQRSPEQHGRHRFGHPVPSVSRVQRSPEQHGRHRFGHPVPSVSRVQRSPEQHGRHRFGHPLPETLRQRRSPLQHGKHRFGHPPPEARREKRSPEQHGRHRYGHPIPEAKRQQ